MIQISKFIFTVCLASGIDDNLKIQSQNYKYAKFIPYENYSLDKEPNKDTINFNFITTEELIEKQNEKIIKKINENNTSK